MLQAINLGVFHLINGLPLPHGLSLLITGLCGNALLRSIFLAGPYVYLWCRSSEASVRAQLGTALLGAAAAVLMARGLSHLFPFSMRPMYNPASGYRAVAKMFAPDMETWSSFPSDTAAVCIALPLGFFALAPVMSGITTLISLVVFVLPRIYMGVHYPSDILVGGLIAVFCCAAASLAGRTPAARRVIELSESRHAAAFYPIALLILGSTTQMFDGLRDLVRTLRSVL